MTLFKQKSKGLWVETGGSSQRTEGGRVERMFREWGWQTLRRWGCSYSHERLRRGSLTHGMLPSRE